MPKKEQKRPYFIVIDTKIDYFKLCHSKSRLAEIIGAHRNSLTNMPNDFKWSDFRVITVEMS